MEAKDQHDDHADALRALAEGQDASGRDEEPAMDEELLAKELAEQPFEQAPAADLAELDEELSSAAESVAELEPAQRRTQQAQVERRARRVHAEHFKRTMVPLMLVVGGILILLSIVSVVLTMRGGEGTMSMGPHGKWFAVAALPLGALLLLGAWLFHREVGESRK